MIMQDKSVTIARVKIIIDAQPVFLTILLITTRPIIAEAIVDID